MSDSSWPKRIAIVGSGAVGCYYGGRLAASGHDVHFLMRRDLETVKNQGLTVKSVHGDFNLLDPQVHGSTGGIGPVDLVIIALKSTDNEALLDLVPPLLNKNTAILTLQNGLGNEAWLGQHFGVERIVGGLCFVCINRTAPGVIEHYSQGAVTIGEHTRPPHDRTHTLVKAFHRSGIECHLAENLEEARWRKLVWNVPFNGLAIACGGIDVSVIMVDPHLETLARDLMHEIIEGAAALGHDIPLSFIEDQLERTRGMGPYKPSSLIDYLSGRPVEIEAIWGEPYRQGQAAGRPMSRLGMLYHLIQARFRLQSLDWNPPPPCQG